MLLLSRELGQLSQMRTSCSTLRLRSQRWRPTVHTLSGWHSFLYHCFFWNAKPVLLHNNFKHQFITLWIVTRPFATMGSCLFTYQRCNLLIFLSPFMFKVSQTVKYISSMMAHIFKVVVFAMLLFVFTFTHRWTQRILPSHCNSKTVPLLPWRKWHLYYLNSCFPWLFCEKTRKLFVCLFLKLYTYRYILFFFPYSNLSLQFGSIEIHHKPDCCHHGTCRQRKSWYCQVNTSHL